MMGGGGSLMEGIMMSIATVRNMKGLILRFFWISMIVITVLNSSPCPAFRALSFHP